MEKSENKFLDVKNWIKSELKFETGAKMGKRFNQDRIDFLKKIINKLEK